MGQKIHPLGLRLGISHNHSSNWFIRSNKYSELVQEDYRIRNCIKDCVKKYIRTSFSCGGITKIIIERKMNAIKVNIYTGFPGLWVTKRQEFEQLKINIQKVLNRTNWLAEWNSNLNTNANYVAKQNIHSIYDNRKFIMTLEEIDKPYAEASIIAEYIALQLESRVAFRKTMKKAIELANNVKHVKGIKIQIAGRLNGAEIARIEWAREGRVPLQTLRAYIDYATYPAQTIYGVLGIKVWVFQE